MEPIIFKSDDPKLWEKIKFKKLKEAVFVTPTDTVYGIGTLFSNRKGVERVIKLKQRVDTNFIILARNINDVLLRTSMTAAQELIVKKYWPNPITFILPAGKYTGTSLAIRVPRDLFLQNLLAEVGGPMLSTSCNVTGTEPVATIAEAIKTFGDKVDFYVDGGEQQNKESSTLVDLTTPKPTILRQGLVRFP